MLEGRVLIMAKTNTKRLGSQSNPAQVVVALLIGCSTLFYALYDSRLGIMLTTKESRISHKYKPNVPIINPKGLGRPQPFRLVECECLQQNSLLAKCINTVTGNSIDVKGGFHPYFTGEKFDFTDSNSVRLLNVTDGFTPEELGLLRLNSSKSSPSSFTCRNNKSPDKLTSAPGTVFIESGRPQVILGIYHQFLAGLLPSLSFIMGICDGTIQVDNRAGFDPQNISRWVINQGTWIRGDKMYPYITRVWDTVRPELLRLCGNQNATFEVYRTLRNTTSDGPDPYPPARPLVWEEDPAYLLAYHRSFYVLRPSHASLIRNAVFKASMTGEPRRPNQHDVLKLVVVDRTITKHRNIEYKGADMNSGDGRALLHDTARSLNSSRAPSGRNYTVTETFYTNDFGKEGLHQMDVLSDADIVLWTHGQQQVNVMWLPECAITIDLLAHKQYDSMYNIASVQTGHIYGYVYTFDGTENLHEGENHAGLSAYPPGSSNSGTRSALRNNPVPVNFTSLEKALSELLPLRWQCLRSGFDSLPLPNITRQHMDFALGKMSYTKSIYDYDKD